MIFIKPAADILTTKVNFHPRDAFGPRAQKGNWRAFRNFGASLKADRMPKLVPFEQNALYAAMRSVYLLGKKWEETEFYNNVIRLIDRGESMWGCRDTETFKKRLYSDIQDLIISLSKHGYLTQSEFMELSKANGQADDPGKTFKIGDYYDKTDPTNEIKVGIGPLGEIIFLEGQHRLAAARLLQIPEVPALVAFRHEAWASLRRAVKSLSSKEETALRVDHPDLERFGLAEISGLKAVRQLHDAGLTEVPIRASRAQLDANIKKKGYSEVNAYLTHDDYLAITSDLGGGHWSNAKRRWVYHGAAVTFSRLANPSSPSKVLEMGTMGINIVPGSHTIDYAEGWNFKGKQPTHAHDGREIPWPIEDNAYELFIALRVYHHLTPTQKEAFLEARRIAKNIIIVAPESYNKVKGSKGIPLSDLIAWNDGVPPTATMEFGEEFGNLYFWDSKALGKG
ncbi:hypothetical protein [Bosea sp. NPDC055594]